MPDTKISALTASSDVALDDELVIVDKSDTTQAGSGTTKKTTAQELIQDVTTAATEDTEPADADLFALIVGGVLKKLTWANLKATLKTYFDTLYPPKDDTETAYKLVVTDTSFNLTVAIKHMDGTDPSASRPIRVKIDNTIRQITAALSVTKNAATNWCNSGSAELAGKEIDYPVFLSYNATDGVVIGFSRYFGEIFSDFSTTAANEKYLAYSGSNAAASDTFKVIGRFAATLSAGAGYAWTVPTFTNDNLKHEPVYETRKLEYTPAYSASGSMTFSSVTPNYAYYKIAGKTMLVKSRGTGTTGGVAANTLYSSIPFSSFISSAGYNAGSGAIGDTSYTPGVSFINSATTVGVRKADNSALGLGASRYLDFEMEFFI